MNSKSSGNIPFLIDIDMGEFGSLASGVYEILLKEADNRKLRPPYASRCTKKESLDASNNFTYTNGACVGRCAALRMYEKCENVIRVLDNYIS